MTNYCLFDVLVKSRELENIKINHCTHHIGSKSFSFSDDFARVILETHGTEELTFEELTYIANELGYNTEVDLVNRSLHIFYDVMPDKVKRIISSKVDITEPKYIDAERAKECVYLDYDLKKTEYVDLYNSKYVDGLSRNAILFSREFYRHVACEIEGGKCIESIMFEDKLPLSVLRNIQILGKYYLKAGNMSEDVFERYEELVGRRDKLEIERDNAIEAYRSSLLLQPVGEMYDKDTLTQIGKKQINEDIALLEKELAELRKERDELDYLVEVQTAIYLELSYRKKQLMNKCAETTSLPGRRAYLLDGETINQISKIDSLEEIERWYRNNHRTGERAYLLSSYIHDKGLELNRLRRYKYLAEDNSQNYFDCSFERYAYWDLIEKRRQDTEQKKRIIFELEREMGEISKNIDELIIQAQESTIEGIYERFYGEDLNYDDIKAKYFNKPDIEKYPKYEGHMQLRIYNEIMPYQVVIELLDLKKHALIVRRRNEVIESNIARALDVDEFLELYVDESDEDTLKLLREESCISKKRVRLICPYCGDIKYPRIIDVVNKHPKCTVCNDGNEKYDEIYLPDIPYIVASRKGG